MVILFWAVTPLQSGIFAVDSVSRVQIQSMMRSAGFISLEEQADTLSLNFMNDGYDIIWLGQRLPPFTTMKYAVAPFLPSTGSKISGENRTWTGNTTLYDTTLSCQKPASLYRSPNDTYKVTADDGNGCVASAFTELCAPVSYDSRNISIYYISACPSSTHEFLATVRWEDGSCLVDSHGYSSFSAMFCRAKYFQQDVEATVNLPDFSVQSTRPISEKRELSSDSFNFTLFEKIIVDKVLPRKPQLSQSPQAPDPNRCDISADTVIAQDVNIKELGVDSSSNLTPFALRITGLPGPALFQPENMQNAFEAAHQMLFALAAQAVLRSPSDTMPMTKGIAAASVRAVVMVPVFTYLVIGFLCAVVILTIALLCIYRKRTLKLPHGPNSVASMMGLISQMPDLLSACQSTGTLDAKITGEPRKSRDANSNYSTTGAQLMETSMSEGDSCVEESTTVSSKPKAWPWEASLLGGFSFILVQAGSIAAVLLLHELILKNNGLPLPSQNAIVQQIVLNFVPTALGTILEPFWVVLNRFLCIIQPFIELRKGSTTASRSIVLEYTSLPPQLAVFRAVSAKHWLLAAVCAVAASANVLTIGLSGLFEIQYSNMGTPVIMNQNLSLSVPRNHTNVPDGENGYPLQTVRANLSEHVTLPPWLSPEYYFLPLSIPIRNETADESYSVTTSGVSSRLDCKQLIENDSDLGYTFALNHDATEANFTIRETLSDGTTIRCFSPNSEIGDNAKPPAETTQIGLRGPPEGRKALEVFIQPISSYVSGTRQEDFACPRMLIAGWVRSSISLGKKYSQSLYGPTRNITDASVNSTFMMCKPRFQMAEFDVMIDPQGHVLGYEQKTAMNETVQDVLAWSLWNATMFLVGAGPGYFEWHNDTYASDWVNLFIKQYTNSTALLDASVPLPGFATLTDMVDKVYQELFAVILQSNQDRLLPAQQVKSVIATLSTGLVVSICFYILLPKPFMPRIPTSVAALASYFSHSHLLQDLDYAAMDEDDIDITRFFESKGRVYGFGRHLGTDGDVHLGIERQPYLFPQHISELGKIERLRMTRIYNGDPDLNSGMI
ncbi:hypothetical protein MYCGRDRAFT_110449 [Paecilomyces variotii No. 5]|uniref:Uncharacterized protein n=1 Tax=Byssochlamys spectabilis (strain No. 5 / NBRC 109023) TaxID=1356009 RepID=V5FY73_BYSSN|nr:hypothetical protein MYCGRDRAFT_110449 [Paecilomyces variotii No. 5]